MYQYRAATAGTRRRRTNAGLCAARAYLEPTASTWIWACRASSCRRRGTISCALRSGVGPASTIDLRSRELDGVASAHAEELASGES